MLFLSFDSPLPLHALPFCHSTLLPSCLITVLSFFDLDYKSLSGDQPSCKKNLAKETLFLQQGREEGTSLDYSAVFFFNLVPHFILYWNIFLQHFFGISSFCAIET